MDGFLISLERLRIHLRSLNPPNDEYASDKIILQCVFVVDLEGLSIQSVVCKRPVKAEHSFSFMTEP